MSEFREKYQRKMDALRRRCKDVDISVGEHGDLIGRDPGTQAVVLVVKGVVTPALVAKFEREYERAVAGRIIRPRGDQKQ